MRFLRLGVFSATLLIAAPLAHARGISSASTTHADGSTETVTLKPDGSKTRTVTNPDGSVRSSEPIETPPPTTAKPKDGSSSVSTTHEDGTTDTITLKPDGAKTRTVTNSDGSVRSSEPLEDPPVTKPAPREGGDSASMTDANGNTVTIKKNPDGSKTRTVTAPDGTELDSEPVTEPPVTRPAPKPGTSSASTTRPDGTTETITIRPDGTKTRTITDADGQVVETGPIETPPPTQTPPRETSSSASTTHADGTTETITLKPDGTKTRTITAPDGTVLESGPITPPPVTHAGDQMLYDQVKKGPVNVTVGMVGRRVDGRQLLEVSMFAVGKGASARTWEVDRIVLQTPNGKLKPVVSQAFYVSKEGTMPGALAKAVFVAIGEQYEAQAERAEQSEGEVCPVTGQKIEPEARKKSRMTREIERQGMAGAMALLTSQARGEVTGYKATFDVTDVPFLKDIPVLGHAFNSRHDARPNPSDPTEVNLVVMVKPSILQAAE